MAVFEGQSQVSAIDIGDKMAAYFVGVKRGQRFAHHTWSKVGPADANVHHIGNGFAGIAHPAALIHRIHQDTHFMLLRANGGNHILSIDQHRIVMLLA